MKISRSLYAVAICLSLAGTAAHAETDTYHNAKVDDALSAIQKVTGVYRGTVTSGSSGAQLGSMEIRLNSVIQVIPNSSNDPASAVSVPVLVGSMKIVGQSTGEVNLSQVAYDSNSGNISSQISVALSDGNITNLMLSGNIASGTFTGSILSPMDSGVNATFSAMLNAPMPIFQATSQSLASSYSGTISNNNTSVQLAVVSSNDPQQTSLNLIGAKQGLSLALSFGKDNLVDTSISFANAQYDPSTQRLVAQAFYSGNVTTAVTLNCSKVQANLNCTFFSSASGNQTNFILSPQK